LSFGLAPCARAPPRPGAAGGGPGPAPPPPPPSCAMPSACAILAMTEGLRAWAPPGRPTLAAVACALSPRSQACAAAAALAPCHAPPRCATVEECDLQLGLFVGPALAAPQPEWHGGMKLREFADVPAAHYTGHQGLTARKHPQSPKISKTPKIQCTSGCCCPTGTREGGADPEGDHQCLLAGGEAHSDHPRGGHYDQVTAANQVRLGLCCEKVEKWGSQ
jgi:hypothetical protein